MKIWRVIKVIAVIWIILQIRFNFSYVSKWDLVYTEYWIGRFAGNFEYLFIWIVLVVILDILFNENKRNFSILLITLGCFLMFSTFGAGIVLGIVFLIFGLHTIIPLMKNLD